VDRFTDDLIMDLPASRIRELGAYILRFVSAMGGDIPVEGRLGNVDFCACAQGGGRVRVYWVQVGRRRISVGATI
jgi:hypothetical protein